MRTLAVDPGLRGCGVALFEGSTLIRCHYVRGSKEGRDDTAWSAMAHEVWDWGGHEADAIVSEFPKVYSAGKSKGDPEDLLQLAAVVGGLAALAAPGLTGFRVLRPYEWKRQVPKDIMTTRTINALTEAESAVARAGMPAKSYQHNVWDAIGIGLFAVGRGGVR